MRNSPKRQPLSMAFEILHDTLVLFCLSPCREGPEVATPPGLRIDLPRNRRYWPDLSLRIMATSVSPIADALN